VAFSGPTGDLFRSGLVASLPPGTTASPATLTAISFPIKDTTLSAAALAAELSRRVSTGTLMPPPWVVGAVAAASLGAYIPLTGAITGIVPTLNPTTAGTPGSVTVTVTGFFTFRVFYLFTDTITFTGTLVLTPAPSADASLPGRILSVPGTTALTVTTTGPSPTLAVAGMFVSLMAPVVGASLQPQIESAINAAIEGFVGPGLASAGFLRSPTSVISARRVTITASDLILRLVLADLLGPAITPIPGHLQVAVSPTPQAGKNLAYTVTVTNAETETPIDQADVTLNNFTTAGAVQTVGPLQTGTGGQVAISATLRPKIRWTIDPITHERTRHFLPPTLTVTKTGFSTVNRRLLQDTDAL
jgi:hypothetical protein